MPLFPPHGSHVIFFFLNFFFLFLISSLHSFFMCACTCAKLLQSCPACVTLWTEARQASLSLGFSRLEYWSGLPFPFPGALPDPGVKPESLSGTGRRVNYHEHHLGQTFWGSNACPTTDQVGESGQVTSSLVPSVSSSISGEKPTCLQGCCGAGRQQWQASLLTVNRCPERDTPTPQHWSICLRLAPVRSRT